MERNQTVHAQYHDPLGKFRNLALKAKGIGKTDQLPPNSPILTTIPPKYLFSKNPTQNVHERRSFDVRMAPDVVKNDAKSVTMTRRVRLWVGCRRFYRHFGLKHFGFATVIVAYSFLGGWIFSELELDNELMTKREKTTNLTNEARNFSEKIWRRFSHHFSSTTADDGGGGSRRTFLEDEFETDFKRILNDALISYQKEHSMYPDEKITWDFWGGMFFAGTVYTTIGYGHYCPVTFYGRVAVMLYALFGIPMLLTLLADMGKLLTRFLNKAYTLFRQGLARVLEFLWHKKFELAATKAKLTEFDFPITLAIFLIVSWIFLCSALFSLWETTWSYFQAFYFFFISLSTVGLGDITPQHPKYMICNFPLVIIGLTLVTLVVNLIQNRIEKLKENAGTMLEYQLGLDGDETESESGSEAVDANGNVTRSATAVDGDGASTNRVTLGIIQTMQKRRIARRRRRGVQTDESSFQPQRRQEKASPLPPPNYADVSNVETAAGGNLASDDDDDIQRLIKSPPGVGRSRETVYFDAA